MTESPLLDTASVARIFLVSETTIRRWLQSGKLQAVKVGRSPRFRRRDIETLLGIPADRDASPAAPLSPEAA